MIFQPFLFRLLFCSFLLFSLVQELPGQVAYSVETVPDPKSGGAGYVSDPDNYIGDSDEAILNDLLTGLEDSTTVQVAVVLVGSIGQDNPKEFAVRLFERWGIGRAGADNGLLIFTVMDQRRTEFETGYGLEGVLPDAVCYRIGMQELVPYFKEEQYGQGLIAAVEKIAEILENPQAAGEVHPLTPPAPVRSGWYAIPAVLRWYLILTLLVHSGLLIWLFYNLFSKESTHDKYMALRRIYSFVWIIFFPLPYLALYFYLRSKLKKLRDQPRFSRLNGKPMRKLSEPEDDAYLEKGQVTEEEIGSVDYDVWITEDGDDILILRYGRRFSKYAKCPKCHYLTYYQSRSEVVNKPTYQREGKKLIEHYCKNCSYRDRKYVTLPRQQKSSSGSSSWGGGSSGGGGAGVSW